MTIVSVTLRDCSSSLEKGKLTMYEKDKFLITFLSEKKGKKMTKIKEI